MGAKILWPIRMDLPKHALEVLIELHGPRYKLRCTRAIHWRRPTDLAEVLLEKNHDEWVYVAADDLLHIKLASDLRIPFRVIQFMAEGVDEEPEVVAVFEICGQHWQVIWINSVMQCSAQSIQQQRTAH